MTKTRLCVDIVVVLSACFFFFLMQCIEFMNFNLYMI
jgi:hypothetical protein